MKKSTLLVIALCFVVCVVVCVVVFSSSSGDSLKESVIGTWERNEVLPSSRGGTYVKTTILEIYQGGTGKYRVLEDGDASRGSTASITWEIKDGVLNVNIRYASLTVSEGYIYDDENNTLKSVDNTKVFTRKNP